MKQPKLFHLLSRIEKKEMSRFEKFLASPYFNSNVQMTRLFDYLRGYYPDLGKVTKEEVHRALWPEISFDPQYVNDRFSELGRLAEQFFVAQECRDDDGLRREGRQRAFRRRGMHAAFARECRDQIQELEKFPLRDSGHAGALWRLYHQLYEDPQTLSQTDGGREVMQLMHYLDLQFIILKLRYFSDLQARKLTYEERHELRMLPAVMEAAEPLRARHPIIDLYCRLVQLFHDGCPTDDFQVIEKLYTDLCPQLAREEQAFILIKLCAVANKRQMEGDTVFNEKMFNLYRFGLDRKLFLQGDIFPDSTFLNICSIGAHAHAFDWTRAFIESHRSLLPAEVAPTAAALGEAYLYFHQGAFEKAYQLLNDVTSTRITYKIRIRALYLRCLLGAYLEQPLSYHTAILSALEAFDRFFRREKELSDNRKESYRNFGRAVGRIVKLRDLNWTDPDARAEVAEWIRTRQHIQIRPWLLDLLEAGTAPEVRQPG